MCGNPFKAPKISVPQESTPPPSVETTDPAVADAEARERRRIMAAKGRRSTILSQAADPGMMGRKTLLGS